MSKLDEIKAALADYDEKMASPYEEYGYWSNRNAGGFAPEYLRALLPVVEAAVALREFSNRLSSWGMTPAQEMERVHLFQDYEDAIDALMSTEDE